MRPRRDRTRTQPGTARSVRSGWRGRSGRALRRPTARLALEAIPIGRIRAGARHPLRAGATRESPSLWKRSDRAEGPRRPFLRRARATAGARPRSREVHPLGRDALPHRGRARLRAIPGRLVRLQDQLRAPAGCERVLLPIRASATTPSVQQASGRAEGRGRGRRRAVPAPRQPATPRASSSATGSSQTFRGHTTSCRLRQTAAVRESRSPELRRGSPHGILGLARGFARGIQQDIQKHSHSDQRSATAPTKAGRPPRVRRRGALRARRGIHAGGLLFLELGRVGQ